MPAGHLEVGETPTQAIIREAQEEIGLTLEESQLQLSHILFRQANRQYLDFFFTAHLNQPQVQNREPTKCDKLVWGSPATPPSPTLEYIHHVFAQIEAGQLYSTLGF